MKQASTLYLKLSVIALGIPVLALCVFLLPKIAIEAVGQATNGALLGFVALGILIVMYCTTIPFYLALFQTLKLLSYIDKNEAFSDLSVKALVKIKKYAITISCLYVLALPLVYIVAEWDDAPGLIFVGMAFVGAPLAIAIFAAVLQRLLQEAIRMKLENELTV